MHACAVHTSCWVKLNRVRSATRRERGLCVRRRGARGASYRAAWEEVLRGISLQLHFTAFVLACEGEMGLVRG